MSEQSLPVLCPENNTGRLTASFPGSLNDHNINKSLSGSIVFKYKQLHYLKGFILKNKSKLETISPASPGANHRSLPATQASCYNTYTLSQKNNLLYACFFNNKTLYDFSSRPAQTSP